jgi:hypothetical protein
MTSNTIYTPFTYCITFTITGQKYYGVRYAKNCHPMQLWTTYFTSSVTIKNLIILYGKDVFLYEIRKTFSSAADARNYEHKFLSKINAAKNPKWLNSSNGSGKFHCTPESSAKAGFKHRGRTISVETREKIRNSSKGRQNVRKGKCGVVSNETKLKISASSKGISKPSKTICCPYCFLEIKGASNAKRWHFENCKKHPDYIKPVALQKPMIHCPFCSSSSSNRLNMQRWHFENCKNK